MVTRCVDTACYLALSRLKRKLKIKGNLLVLFLYHFRYFSGKEMLNSSTIILLIIICIEICFGLNNGLGLVPQMGMKKMKL